MNELESVKGRLLTVFSHGWVKMLWGRLGVRSRDLGPTIPPYECHARRPSVLQFRWNASILASAAVSSTISVPNDYLGHA